MSVTRATIAVLAVLAATGCSLIDPNNVMGRSGSPSPLKLPDTPVPAPVAPGLSAATRAAAFDFVWGTINDRYYDAKLNGVDWKSVGERYRPLVLGAKTDEDFWEELDRMTGELKDAHTRVESPKRAEQIRNDESVSLGFAFIPLAGKLVVSGVSPDSDAWFAGVRPGMALVTIEGEDAKPAYEKMLSGTRFSSTDRARHLRATRKLSAGDPDSSATLGFERVDGTRFGATLKRRKASTAASASWRVLPSGFGYVRLSQWTTGATNRAIEGIKALKDTPGMIIDLRGNPGGSLFSVQAMMSSFFTERTEAGRSLTRDGKPIGFFMGAVEVIKLKHTIAPNKDAYTAPVIVLVNASSGSASEYFSGAMQALGRATVMGEPTCGCLLGFLGYATIPGGGELAYSEIGFVLANGKRIEGEGVIPERVVPVTLADLQLNRDRTLEEAQVMAATLRKEKLGVKMTGDAPK